MKPIGESVDLHKLTKAALFKRYKEGKGGHYPPKKKPSQRDKIRQWNRKHPDYKLNLRTKTGRPPWWAEMKEKNE